MTVVYFIRHARSRRDILDEITRPLTAEGISDSEKLTNALINKGITHIISSPCLRTLQTVEGLSRALSVVIETNNDFRERSAGKWLGDGFFDFCKRQWEDFDFKIKNGESLKEVQERNIRALKKYLKKYEKQTFAVSTHGTALSTIINYFYPEYGFDDFLKIADLMPFVLKAEFDGSENCMSAEMMFSVKSR